MELKDTVGMMISSDYKERFKAEYLQTFIRYIKLMDMVNKWKNGELNFVPTCPQEIYDKQLDIMKNYLTCLAIRETIEKIGL